jgi:hypothetical protein
MVVASTPALSLVSLIKGSKRVPIEYLASQLDQPSEQVRVELQDLADKQVVCIHADTDEVELN